MNVFCFNTKEEWLTLRQNDVTSSDVASLYGLNPHKSARALFIEKTTGISSFQGNQYTKWGQRFESVIGNGVAEDLGWVVEPLKVYMRCDDLKMGSSFDFKVLESPYGIGLMEIKNVDAHQFKNMWIKESSVLVEAPAHIELQLQHQMEVANMDWCALVAMVGGNQPYTLIRKREREIGADIREKIKQFWIACDTNNPPEMDYFKDESLIEHEPNFEEIEHPTPDLQALILQWVHDSQTLKTLERINKERRNKIIDYLKGAAKVKTDEGYLLCSYLKPSSGTLITQEMVGKTIGVMNRKFNLRFIPRKKMQH